MHTRTCTDPTAWKTRQDTIAEWNGHKPAMLVSSVQAVVACHATAPRVCTLVLFIALGTTCILIYKIFPMHTQWPTCTCTCIYTNESCMWGGGAWKWGRRKFTCTHVYTYTWISVLYMRHIRCLLSCAWTCNRLMRHVLYTVHVTVHMTVMWPTLPDAEPEGGPGRGLDPTTRPPHPVEGELLRMTSSSSSAGSQLLYREGKGCQATLSSWQDLLYKYKCDTCTWHCRVYYCMLKHIVHVHVHVHACTISTCTNTLYKWCTCLYIHVCTVATQCTCITYSGL